MKLLFCGLRDVWPYAYRQQINRWLKVVCKVSVLRLFIPGILDETEWPPVLYFVTQFIKKTLAYSGSKVLDVLD